MERELEEMRQQMAILKEKLQEQSIVNDRLIRQSMKKNVVSINRRYLIVSILCVLMIPYGYWAFVMLNGMSMWFWGASSVLMLTAFIYTYFNGRKLRDDRLLDKDLVETQRIVAQAKKLDHDWLKIGIPMAIAWFSLFCYECYRLFGASDSKFFIVPGIIGGVVGLAIGLRLHFKTQDNYQEVLDQIEEIQSI